MASNEEGRGDRRRGMALLLAASERLYGALLALYPEAFRRRYASEMRRDFCELSREGLEEGGATELAGVWAATLPDLALTALKERSTVLARNHYLPVPPVAVAKLGGLSALLGGALGAAYYLLGGVLEVFAGPIDAGYGAGPMADLFSLLAFFVPVVLCLLGVFGLYGAVVARRGRTGSLAGAGGALAAVSVASALVLGGYDSAKALAAWTSSSSYAYYEWEILLTGALWAAHRFGWILGLLLLGVAATRGGLPGRLRVLPFATAALWPASFYMSVLLLPPSAFDGFDAGNVWSVAVSTLFSALPFIGSALLGWALLRSYGAPYEALIGTEGFAVAGGPTGGTAGTARRMTRSVVRTASRARATRTDASAEGATKEKELLGALGRRGALTVAGAALETSLTVEEAERMLSALAAKGHLEVIVEHGRLLYSLWERDSPL